MADDTDAIKEVLTTEPPAEPPIPNSDLLGTGSTLLNLACSGRPRGGLAKGKYFFFVGDSSSGKTFLVLTCLAEANATKRFDNYRFIYDNVEDGALMDFSKYFGQGVADRVELLASEDIEEFYFNCDDALDNSKPNYRPCIYILDSMDALLGSKDEEKIKKRKAAKRKGPTALAKLAGDYGDGKAKTNSGYIRSILHKLRDTRSILIVVSQTRDNFNEDFEDKCHAGGHALKFYATLQIWTSRGKTLKKSYKEKELQIGITAKIAVKKNRITGKEWSVAVPIYHSYGIDDIGSCVDYCVEWKHWPKTDAGIITADAFGFVGKREALIKKIEDEGLQIELRKVTAEVWATVEEACRLKRRPRYE